MFLLGFIFYETVQNMQNRNIYRYMSIGPTVCCAVTVVSKGRQLATIIGSVWSHAHLIPM